MTNGSELAGSEVEALHAALDDEYRAWATYEQVIEDFGPVRPFVNIVDAEARHIEALSSLFEQYGVPLPENSWTGKMPRHASLEEACRAAVAAEMENAELYERLFASTDRPQILRVFRNLLDASQQRHLPAFRRCVHRSAEQS